MLLALACTWETSLVLPGGVDSAVDEEVEAVPGLGAVFDPWTVQPLLLELEEEAIQALREEPTSWVSGTLVFREQTFEEVGVRLKGSASFQEVDHKPAWKIKLGEYVDGQRLEGLERLTLNNEVWDPTMMAETMAYRSFRDNGSPAPLTGYAHVTLNGVELGVYALLESMDDDFVDRVWPGSDGGLWEMTRNCDFTGDCSCFDLQETGEAFDPAGITRGCEAVAVGTTEALKGAFDWDALIAFLAVERVVNHPDSYSYNLNNFFVHHDPLEDRLALSPWGADSTFIYAYPPSASNPNCEPLYRDVDEATSVGWLGRFCEEDPSCRADLHAKMVEVADWMEAVDLVGEMERNRDLLDPWAEDELAVNWTTEDREARVACFLEWTAQRPAEVRALAE